jgi:hypothetical protein
MNEKHDYGNTCALMDWSQLHGLRKALWGYFCFDWILMG